MATTIVNRVVCLFTIVLIISTAIHSALLNIRPIKYSEMAKRFQNFKCGTPRPRSFKISELYPNLPEYAVSPSRIVLHRCEEALGCCDRGEKCTKQDSEALSIELSLVEGSVHKFVTREAEDHTSCYCVPEEKQIK